MSASPRSRIPHSWSIENWPADVHPNSPTRARYLVRVHRDELMKEGALARVGREIVILGERYSKWLEKQTTAVAGYEIAPNRTPTEATA